MLLAVATVARRTLTFVSDEGSPLREMARVTPVMTPPAGNLGARVGVVGSAGVTGLGAAAAAAAAVPTGWAGDKGWIAIIDVGQR